MELLLPKFMLNVKALVFGLSAHFWMVIFLALHPVGSVSLNSFVLLEHLAVFLASTLTMDC